MNEYYVEFFGSAPDLASLKKVLADAGCEEVENFVNSVHASSDIVPLAIAFAMVATPKACACLQTWMQERGKRFVSRDGSKKTMSGPFSEKAYKEFFETTDRVNLEDVEPPPEHPNREGEMGYHVGRDKPKPS